MTKEFDLVTAFHQYYEKGQPPTDQQPPREPTQADMVLIMAKLFKNRLTTLIPNPDQQLLITQRQMPARHPAVMASLRALRAKPGDPPVYAGLQLMDARGGYALLSMGYVGVNQKGDHMAWRYGLSFGKTIPEMIQPNDVQTALDYLTDHTSGHYSSEIDLWSETNRPEYILRYRLAAEKLFTEKHKGNARFIQSIDIIHPDFGWVVSTVRASDNGDPICFSANAIAGTRMTDSVWMIHKDIQPDMGGLGEGLGLSISSDMFNPDLFVRALEAAAAN